MAALRHAPAAEPASAQAGAEGEEVGSAEQVRPVLVEDLVSGAVRAGADYDPATGQVSGQVDFATASVVDEAVAAADEAFTRWRSASLARRMSVMFSFRELLNARKSDLAQIITAEHGKVLSDAAGEIQRALEAVEFEGSAAIGAGQHQCVRDPAQRGSMGFGWGVTGRRPTAG
ncbi:aldehyde dehydrogenase family protein [Micromonospora sp. NBC_00389]